MSETRASWLALWTLIAGGLLLYLFFRSVQVRMVVAALVALAFATPLVWLAYHGIREALLRWGKPVDDPYRDWEAW